MVARSHEPRDPISAAASGVLSWWRRGLGLLVQPLLSAVRTRPGLAAGLLGMLVGTLGAGAAVASADGIVIGARTGLALPLWAGVRLFVLVAISKNGPRVSRSHLVAAWGWSLVPFAAALTPGLHAIAFVASALVLWYMLERLGTSRRGSLSLVAWAYGFQMAVVLAAWLTRNLILAGRIVLGN